MIDGRPLFVSRCPAAIPHSFPLTASAQPLKHNTLASSWHTFLLC